MQSADRILAKRYARAFDALSSDGKEASARFQALRAAAQTLASARAYMQNPAAPLPDKKALVLQAAGEDKAAAGFLCALLDAKRYYLLDECVREAGALADARLGIVRARVQTAFALDDAQKKRVEESLSRFSGRSARAEFETDPSLLGGLRAQMDDVLIDGTLKRQFEKLREELIK